jgi:hypothetical protein
VRTALMKLSEQVGAYEVIRFEQTQKLACPFRAECHDDASCGFLIVPHVLVLAFDSRTQRAGRKRPAVRHLPGVRGRRFVYDERLRPPVQRDHPFPHGRGRPTGARFELPVLADRETESHAARHSRSPSR